MEHTGFFNEDPSSSSRTTPDSNQLVWVNYTNPTAERKREENKTIVRKVAKLSTTRPRTKPGTPRGKARIVPLTVASSEVGESENIRDTVLKEKSQNYPASNNTTPRIWRGNSDPFDSLPAPTSSLSFSLLNRYCESVHIRPECPTSCSKTQGLRRRYLLPTLVQSKGTLHVAFLHLARKWRLPDAHLHSKFLAHYQRETILEMQKALQNPALLVPIEMFLMIGKLATAASYQGDNFAVEAHYNGMAQLFMHHWDDLARHPLFVLGIFAFWSAISPSSTCCQEQADNSAQKTSPTSVSANENLLLQLPMPDAFARLYLSEMISRATLDVIPEMTHLLQLITDAKNRTLTTFTAKELLRLKWHCSARLQKLGGSSTGRSATQFERTLLLVLPLILTLSVNHSMPAVAEYYSPAIKERLSSIDLNQILECCPEALLWILLVVGSSYPTDESSTPFYLMTLRLVANRLNIARHENALLYAKQFIWTSELDEGAARFWSDAVMFWKPSDTTTTG